MNILVTGATGATGRLLVDKLLEKGHSVKAVVRSPEKLSEKARSNGNLTIIQSPILDLSSDEIKEHLKNCDAAASCLGHNITAKGMFGKPRKLVRDAARKVCLEADHSSRNKPFRFVLMNTTGNRNENLQEKRTIGESLVTGLIRLLVPPHSDNEQAAEVLRREIGSDHRSIEWVAVRPDSLIDNEKTSPYDLFESPQRSPIFNPGKTSRINVADFMAELISDEELFAEWKGRMPVIYNRET